MRKLLTILIFITSIAAHGQQNMTSPMYRFWNSVRIGTGINDATPNNANIFFHLGLGSGHQGIYFTPQDTLTIATPVQGMIVALSSDLGRWYFYNGFYWERMGGANGGGGGGEVPLTFNNGLVRTSNVIRLGGSLITNTIIDVAGYNLSFLNAKIGIGTSSPNYNLDVPGTARVQTLPNVFNRDTLLTYDPATKQLSYTVRPHCADSASTLDIVAGTDVDVNQSAYSSPSLINKTVKVWREGLYQTTDEYTFSSSTGTFAFTPNLNYRERIHIEALCKVFASVVPLGITTQAGVILTTESGQTIIYF